MADDFSQVETILKTVLTHPAFTNGCGPFTRTLQVTTDIADIKVTESKVIVHPGWAVDLGPVNAAAEIRRVARLFDERRAEARRLREAELRDRLLCVVEDIRRLGAEHLLDEAIHAPVARRRSLLRGDS